MKTINKRHMAWTLTAVVAVMAVLSGCRSRKPTETTAAPAAGKSGAETAGAETTEPAEPALPEEPAGQPEESLKEGNVVCGFTVDSLSDSQMLQAELIGFTHEKSGAKLLWVKNSDPELAFSISYHTPYIDETDTNHVFEHAIVASSEKYPSKDLFFDMAGKSYSTFLNAFTYDTFTTYPFSSESEEQFMKLMDGYLSCMVAPDVLTEENFFKREALRYELNSPEEEIQMIGTVYSEDFSFLTDMFREAENNLKDTLYPGQYASNVIGRSHRSYQDLTYEAMLDTYERCYHFDNSLIFLYGDMDYQQVLSFLDSQYLSKAARHGTDLSAYMDPALPDGYEEKTVSVPAFEGDQTENASQIDYGFSLEDKSWQDLTGWLILSEALNHENSSFQANLKARGILNPAQVFVNLYNAKPYVQFSLFCGDPEQSQAFKSVVDETLAQIEEEGIDREILRSILKQTETSSYLFRDQINAGVNLFPQIANYWTHTGNYDYYNIFEQTLKDIEADRDQEIFCRLAAGIRQDGRSALVTNVPQPGLAEAVIQERDDYLADMKASMTHEEIRQMIEDTKEFREWNETEMTNSDFPIDPSDIPDEEPYTAYEITEGDGVTYYMAPAEVEKAGSYCMYLDISDFSDKEHMELGLFLMLMGNMGTREHSLEEIMNLESEYLYSYQSECVYPNGEDLYPMMKLSWTTLTEDYEAGLALLLEILGSTDFADTDRIGQLLARDGDSYDVSRAGNKQDVAISLAASYVYRGYAYYEAYRTQEFYYYLKDIKSRLEEDPSYGTVLAESLQSLSHKLLKKGRLILTCAAPEADLESIKTISAGLLETLESKEAAANPAPLPQPVQKQAVIVESPDQYTVTVGNCYEQEGFSGTYVPFLMAASDRYLVPKLRFQMGAYSCGSSFSPYTGSMLLYTYSDPNGAETLKVFEGTADAIANMELTQEELDGYILTAIATSGMARGVLAKPLRAMDEAIAGRDTGDACHAVNTMKQASTEDQKAAAEYFRQVLSQAGTATVGSETQLKADQNAYDQLLSYKAGGKE